MKEKNWNEPILDDEPRCPECGGLMKPVYENIGFREPDPSLLMEVAQICTECGYKENI